MGSTVLRRYTQEKYASKAKEVAAAWGAGNVSEAFGAASFAVGLCTLNKVDP